jgi:alkaline phosphatase D
MTRAHPPFRKLLEAIGVRGIYDDHEFRNDWDSMYAVTEAQRYFAAMQAWDEFFPLRGKPDSKYRRWRHGAHLECILLDTRRYRSPNAMPDGPAKTMLGAAQKAWLFDALKTSTATFKLVLTSVPLDYGDGNDHWRSFQTERNELYDAVLGIPGVLFMSADQHWFADNRHANNIREFQVGPLARGIGIPMVEWAGVAFKASRMNAAIVDVTPTTLTITALGVGGEQFYTQTFNAADLTPTLQARL